MFRRKQARAALRPPSLLPSSSAPSSACFDARPYFTLFLSPLMNSSIVASFA